MTNQEMTKAADLHTGMRMASTPIYPNNMFRIVSVRRGLTCITIELEDGRVQYLNPACLVHAGK
jgi:hypothetical protein